MNEGEVEPCSGIVVASLGLLKLDVEVESADPPNDLEKMARCPPGGGIFSYSDRNASASR
jgi:hypothetical protein